MNRPVLHLLTLGAAVLLAGCGVYHRQGLAPVHLRPMESAIAGRAAPLAPALEKKILALNPTNVTAQDVRDVLTHAPAPRVVNVHGGIASVIPRMVSFSEFLIGMGYPAVSLTNPSDGTYSFSCYESSEKIAGAIAWFYEKEGLRPLMVGHSQGGMQVVKVLHKFAGKPSVCPVRERVCDGELCARRFSHGARLPVWNPLTWEKEPRWDIEDPLTGQRRPVVGLQLPYATSVGAGGLTRILPNQWDMAFRLRRIPDSVEEFTGFCKEFDLLGGDWLGYGSANHFKSDGTAVVRNVWLPVKYKHGEIPNTKHLLNDPAMMDWINQYRPANEPVTRPETDVQFEGDSAHILWAAEVWFSIKKHWVQELQRLIRARNSREAGS